jgi:dephospho-CoA kinase
MHQKDRPILIGITGSIGSGKTSVAKTIENYYPVIYSDRIVHDLLNSKEVIEEISVCMCDILTQEGLIDRKRLADIVFNNETHLTALNRILHPKVLKILQTKVNECKEEYVFIEVPLLFETHIEKCFDYIVLVYSNEDLIYKRLSQNRNQTMSDVNKRLIHQLDIEHKQEMSDNIINNEGTLSELNKNVNDLLSILKNIRRRDIIPLNKVLLFNS